MVRLKDGIHLVPGANAEKIVETFEAAFLVQHESKEYPVTGRYKLKMVLKGLTPADSSELRS